jgi:cytochrome d ubiquinol oxidase subunit I
LSLFTIGDQDKLEDVVAIKLPVAMSILTCNNLDCEVQGIRQLQADFEERFGPGNYVPPVIITYWTFRIMLTVGMALIALVAFVLFLILRGRLAGKRWLLYLLLLAMPLPYLANTSGWVLAEVGRQPWIVYEVMLTSEGVSSTVPATTVLLSLLTFTLVYTTLLVVNVYLLAKFARKGTSGDALLDSDSPAGGSAPAALAPVE